MKRFLTAILCLTLLASLLGGSALAVSKLGNFKKTDSYEPGRFSDVAPGAWYESGISAAYAHGLVKGVSESSFGTGVNLKLFEAVTLAARLHSIYHNGSISFPDTEPWYQAYVDYAAENGILSSRQLENAGAVATRLEFAELMAAALPGEAFPILNSIEAGEIPDIPADAAPIYTLYRAGIITGKTEAGHFYSADPILREEVAVIVARIAEPALREMFSPQPGLSLGDGELSMMIRLGVMASINATGSCKLAILNPSSGPSQPLGNAKKMVPVISQRIAEALSYTKDKPELKETIEYLETASLASEEIGKLVPALSAASPQGDWDAAIAVLEGCTAALKRAEATLG